MRAYLLNGSPNEDGDTYRMLSVLDEHLADNQVQSEVVNLGPLLAELDEPYCTVCSAQCEGACYRDTGLETLYKQLARADIVVAGSPVYFGTVSAQMKAFWDMTRGLRASGGLLHTVGAAVSVGAGRFGGQETTVRAIHDMMFIQGMVIIGDSCFDSLGHQGVCAVSPVDEDPGVSGRLAALAEGLIEVANVTAPLREQYRDMM